MANDINPVGNILIIRELRKLIGPMVSDVFMGLVEGKPLLNETKEIDCHQFPVGKVGAVIIALAVRAQNRVRIIAPPNVVVEDNEEVSRAVVVAAFSN